MKKTAKRSLRVALALLVCFVMMSSFFAPVFAWYLNRLSTKLEIESGIVGSYFEQGNGTEDTPYVIARPIQLYYFAWLQNLGYFDGDNPSSETSDKKYYFTLGADIDMSENPEYQVLPPVGSPDHPFVGVFDGKYHYAPTDDQGNAVTDQFDPNNTIEGTYHTISNVIVSNDNLSNIPQNGEEEQQFIGLFGVIGSMTNHSVTGTVKNFGLYNVVIETKTPLDDNTIIGIVAGYCNGTFEGIGVSDCTVKVKNGVSPAQVTTYNADDGTSTNVTPGMISFSLVGFSDQTYQAYNISPVAGGNEFGGSLAMESIYDKITAARTNANTTNTSYYVTKVVEIDADGVRTETFSNEINLDYHRSMENYQNIYFMKEYERKEDGEVAESITAIDRYSSSSYTYIGDGLGNYLEAYYSGGTYGLRNTTDFNSATRWTITTYSGNYRFAATVNNATRYLYYNNGLTLNSSTYNWVVTNTDTDYQDYLIKSNSGNNYITFDRNTDTWTTTTNTNDAIMYLYRSGGSAVTQYTYLNGGKVIEKKQAVTTITHTRYDAYLIQDGDGNYLVANAAQNATISTTTNSANATAWRFSNGANGGTFSIQADDETVYYLYNNNGTLTVSTSSTNWTVSNGQISNGGYYLMYLDGAWKLLAETTYFSIDDGNGAYLNFANNNLTGGASSTTRWHIDASNKIYTYNGTTKTYLYNSNGTLTTTTTANTATAWTVNNTNNTISSNGYYLMYLDGAWKVLAETTYFSIDDGNGTYLNFANNNLTGGASSTTRWHIDASNKIYTYNGTTKTYLYNNNGTLTTTTTANTATAWTVNNTTHTISAGGYYLMYDGTWKVFAETTYYSISDGNGTYLNFANPTLTAGSGSTTKWHIDDGKIYTYVGTTKTYLYNNNGTLATTTNSGTASTWMVSNGNITTGGYYLCYNDSTWGLKEETEYYLFDDGNGNYLNLSGGNVATGTSSNATRWYFVGGKLYAYNGTTKTYLYNNGGALETTTNSGTASNFVLDDVNHSITTGNYSLCYNDNAWGLKEEDGYYLINDGSSHYLNLSSGSIGTGTSSNATKWYFVGGKLYAYNGTTKTYLYNNNGVLGTTVAVGSATTWMVSNGNIKAGDYYLCYENGWLLTNETSYYLISDGSGNYFNLTNSGFEVGTSLNATQWRISSGKIYTYVNGTATYLVNSNGSLDTTVAAGSASTWTVGADSITNGGYNLVYQNGWLLTNETLYYLISDGSGNYFNLTSSGYEVGTSSTATAWHFSNGASGGKIYSYVNGTKTFMQNSTGTLSTTTTEGSASTWTVSSGQISNGGYNLVNSNGWLLTNVSSYYTISDQEGHYLNLTGSGYSVGTSSNATAWQMTSTTSGKIYTYINGTATYLYNNSGTLSTTTNSGTATTWDIDNTAKTISNGGYYLKYDGDNWELTNSLKYYISDGNGHYLNLNASTHLTEVGTESNATLWTFTTSGSNYYVSADANGTPYYLNYDNGNMVPDTSRSTTWTVGTNKIYCTDNSIEYDMFYDGVCWTIVESTLDEYYIISDGTNYMGTNETTTSSWWGDETTYSIINQTVRSYAAKFTFASGVLTTTGGAITTNINGTTRYLYRSGNSSTTVSLNGSQGSYSNWVYTNSGGHQRISARRSSTRYYYIRYNNGWTSLSSYQSSSTSNTYVLDGTAHIDDCSTKTATRELPKMVGYSAGSYNFTNSISSNNYDLSIDVSNNNYNLTANAPYTAFSKTANSNSIAYNVIANTSSANYNITVQTNSSNYNLVANVSSQSYDITNQTEATTTIWKATTFSVETIEVKTKETYIPLATNENGTTSLKNTGYIVSGSNYADKETYAGDIRVSYYTISGNLTNALNGSTTYNDSRLEVVTRTYLSNGFKRISDSHNSSNSSVSTTLSNTFPNNQKTSVSALGLDKYEEARNQLEETLTGQTNVYGLHFMDAQINANRLVNIEKATINGSVYHNYKMPQDCIDFNLSMRGSLNFFAGTYFPGNTAFFSLHRIFRTDGEIDSIREIDKIYGNPDDTSKNYIYKYTDEASAPALPSGYVLMFDTDWIKNPTMVENAVYYFEIPVNAGEYALGSVNGADGAYLMYLDIGASAQSLSDGTTLETSIKGIDFVTEDSLGTNAISTTLLAISSTTPSSAVIILKNRFQGDISFTVQQVTVQGSQVLRISYVLSDTSAKDYVLYTVSDSSVEVVDSTVYT